MGEPIKEIYDIEQKKNMAEEIASFLTKKRRQIMQILYTRGRMSNGELANAVGTSVASLSNILLKFESFQYRLIDGKNEGKHRYYVLTDLGMEFIQDESQKNVAQKENIVFRDAFLAIQQMKNSLRKIQDKMGEKWEWALDNALISCISYGQFPTDQDEDIDDYFQFVEKALLNDYENGMWGVMKEVCKNPILSERMVQFLDKFESLRPLLSEKENGQINDLQLYEFLGKVIDISDGEEANLGIYAEGYHLKEEQIGLLAEFVNDVIVFTAKKEKDEIYNLLNKFTAGYENLSAFMAIQIDNRHKRDSQI